MNILIPHRWLLDHLDTRATPEQIRTQLSLAGPSVERIEDKLGDQVYDIEITTNRVDSMSVRGIAREAAVILDYADIPAKLKPLNLPKLKQFVPEKNHQLPLPKITNKTNAINRIMAVVLTNINTTETPAKMAKRLTQIDQNVHWAAIDITNYITHELGHPCHAFDYDKIMQLGGEIIIDEAKKGETFTTLDNETYQTVGGEIVFRNPRGEIIDLPAIKGTANTAVDKNTKNILFWIENMDAKKVRFASMTHDIRTVAAQLNEKHVDPHLAEPTITLGVKLYQEIIGAQVASKIYDDFTYQSRPKPINTPLAVFERYLGFKLPKKTINQILTKLGCQVKSTKDKLTVTPPTYRQYDLAIPVDLVEEVARIYGYHNLPGKIMTGQLPLKRPKNDTFDLEEKIKNFLSVLGLYEVYTYSLVSEALAKESGYAITDHLKLANPLTDDKVYLRRSLLPSLNQVIGNNPTKENLKVFELAKVYHPQGDKTQRPKEVMKLGLSLRTNYRSGRGILEALLDHLFVYDYKLRIAGNGNTADILAKKYDKYQVLGMIKVATHQPNSNNKTSTTNDYQLINIELDLLSLAKVANKHPKYQPLVKTAVIKEDLTFIIPSKVRVGEVMGVMNQASSLVKKVELKEIYQDRYTFTLTYQDATKNLTDQNIIPIRKEIVSKLKSDYQVDLVGKLS